MKKQWWHNTEEDYCLSECYFPRRFYDSNGDGIVRYPGQELLKNWTI